MPKAINNYHSLKKNYQILIMPKAINNYHSLKKNYQTLIMLKAINNDQSLKKNYQTLQCPQSLKKNYLLRTAVLVFLSLFMLHTNEYAYTQEIKTEASDVPAVLSPIPTDCKVQWERAVSLLIRELSFLTLDLAVRPG